jgi:CheY-like chemotaxis protein
MPAKRILIAEDDAQLVEVMTERCHTLGIELDWVRSGRDAICAIAKDPPDLVILDLDIPDGNGRSVFEAMSSNPRLGTIPVVFLSGASNEDAIHRFESMGAHYVLKGTGAWELLEPILRSLPGTSNENSSDPATEQPRRGRVLIVDDDPDMVRVLGMRLAENGLEVETASSGLCGFWTALRTVPDVIIADYCMPDGCADLLLRRLKDHPITRSIPIVIVTGRGGVAYDFGLEREMRNLGAEACLGKPLDFEALWLELVRFLLPAAC